MSEGKIEEKKADKKRAWIIALTNGRKVYGLHPDKYGLTFDETYLIFGNNEARVKAGSNLIYSNFGANNNHFITNNAKINELFGEGDKREVEMEFYEVFKIVFE